jgi:recombinational DNA repair protein (RecF pathway)
MPNIILKKTFKTKPGFQVATEKSFSFHGTMTKELIDEINRVFQSTLRFTLNANKPLFKMDYYGHYSAVMNHECQKNHEEDLVVAILDIMERNGWMFKFQYDSETASTAITGSSETKRESFIFQKVVGKQEF